MENVIKKYLWDKRGAFKMEILKSPLFLSVLGVKISASFLFASHYLYSSFVPFIKQFVFSGFANPYLYFFNHGIFDAFPYPKMMLWILSAPVALVHFFGGISDGLAGNFDIFLIRVPIIMADIVILLVLARWLKKYQKSVLLYYWCSPILFYISYVHGQLDVLPIMFLFVFLHFLFKEKFYWAILFLSFAISAKTGILIVLPFVTVYYISKKIGIAKAFALSAIPIAAFAIFNFDYLLQPGFIDLVLKTKEEFKVFDFQFSIGSNFVIYIVPLVYFFLFVQSLTYKRFSKDLFLIFLGFSFGILTIFIPPMQGWYYWVIPFLVYFFIKLEKPRYSMFLLLNVFYFAYFLIIRQSDLFEIFHLSIPLIESLPNLYGFISARGVNADVAVNIIFSILQGTLFMNVWWIYRKGVENYLLNKIYYKPYLIGIAGDSGSGKSTLAGLIENLFGKNNVSVITGDDMHKWERGNEMWTKYTHLDPRANELHVELEHAYTLKGGDFIERKCYDHDTGKFALPTKFESKKVIIFEGLHSLFLNKMRNVLDLKIFVSPDEDLRVHWKICRDTQKRRQSEASVVEELRKRQGDAEQFIKIQEKYSDIIISLKNKKQIVKITDKNYDSSEIVLELTCSNGVDLSRFLDAVSRCAEVSYMILDQRQIVKFTGNLDGDAVKNISYEIVPEMEELIAEETDWKNGYNGLVQLFIIYYIFESMRMEKYEK